MAGRVLRVRPGNRVNRVNRVNRATLCARRVNRMAWLARRDNLRRAKLRRAARISRGHPKRSAQGRKKRRKASATNSQAQCPEENEAAENYSAAFFCVDDECEDYLAADTAGRSTKLAEDPPSKILIVAFL